MNRLWASGLALAALAIAPSSHASDHIDGLKTALDNAADITDLYAFTSPADDTKFVLVMNVHPTATSRARFSNAVDYIFRIRPIEDTRTLRPSDASREQTIRCSFAGGTVLVDPNQHATCTFKLGDAPETLTFDTRSSDYGAGGSGSQNGLRVFAGVRSDTWFLDLVKTVKYINGVQVPNGPGKNGLHGANVLSIVIEVDKARLSAPLVAVTAQTVRK